MSIPEIGALSTSYVTTTVTPEELEKQQAEEAAKKKQAAASEPNCFEKGLNGIKSLGENTGVTGVIKSTGRTLWDTAQGTLDIATAGALKSQDGSCDIFGAVGRTAGDAMKNIWDTGASTLGIGEKLTSGVTTGKSQSHITDTLKGDSTAGIMGYSGSLPTSNNPEVSTPAKTAQVNTASNNSNTVNESTNGVIGAFSHIFGGLSNILGGKQTQATAAPASANTDPISKFRNGEKLTQDEIAQLMNDPDGFSKLTNEERLKLIDNMPTPGYDTPLDTSNLPIEEQNRIKASNEVAKTGLDEAKKSCQANNAEINPNLNDEEKAKAYSFVSGLQGKTVDLDQAMKDANLPDNIKAYIHQVYSGVSTAKETTN